MEDNKMTEIKQKVLDRMNELERDMNEISIRAAALEVGVNHLKTQDCIEIMNRFCEAHPDYRIVKLVRTPLDSLFVAGVVTTLTYEDEEVYDII